MEDLDNPEMIGHYEHNTVSVDHNLYVKGDLLYQANYTSGLRILDIQRSVAGKYLNAWLFRYTTPDNNQPKFSKGLWSVYPYLIR